MICILLRARLARLFKVKSLYLNTEYLGFLIDNNPLPLEIRKAINYGFDRRKMIKYLRNNIGSPAINGFIPIGSLST